MHIHAKTLDPKPVANVADSICFHMYRIDFPEVNPRIYFTPKYAFKMGVK